MAFVSRYYEVLGRDILDWMIWPAQGLAVAIPLGLVGVGFSYVWQPFLWLTIVAYAIVFVASAWALVFIAAAGVQVLINQLEINADAALADSPVIVRILRSVPVKLWLFSSCTPAALSLPVFAWGVLFLNDEIMFVGLALFLLPLLATLALASLTRLTCPRGQHAK